MEARAISWQVDSTARKARLVADVIRGKMVGEAMSMLALTIKKSVSNQFLTLVKSAVANLQSKHADAQVDIDNLHIKEIQVGQGTTLKRMRARAQGRAGRILKRSCHISVTISD